MSTRRTGGCSAPAQDLAGAAGGNEQESCSESRGVGRVKQLAMLIRAHNGWSSVRCSAWGRQGGQA
jgi:hypothetical protein